MIEYVTCTHVVCQHDCPMASGHLHCCVLWGMTYLSLPIGVSVVGVALCHPPCCHTVSRAAWFLFATRSCLTLFMLLCLFLITNLPHELPSHTACYSEGDCIHACHIHTPYLGRQLLPQFATCLCANARVDCVVNVMHLHVIDLALAPLAIATPPT